MLDHDRLLDHEGACSGPEQHGDRWFLGAIVLAAPLVTGLALLALVVRDEVRSAPSVLRRAAAALAAGALAASLWLLVGQLQVEDGVICTIWPATDALGPDGSSVAVASEPDGAPRRVARECIRLAHGRIWESVGLLVVAVVIYVVARRRAGRSSDARA